MRPIVLFVNHNEERCGVFQFGQIIGNALTSKSSQVYWFYREMMTGDQYWEVMNSLKPDAVIFNYHPATSSLASEVVKNTTVPTLGIVHEPEWFDSNEFLAEFDNLIVCGELQFNSKYRIYFTSRTIPDYLLGTIRLPKMPTFGSFGFGFGGKGYGRLIDQVQAEYDDAVIRLRIPYARFGDEEGVNAHYTADACRAKVTKCGIRLDISHEFLNRREMLRWLEGNTINCFLYDSYPGRGISSAIDFALAVRRPIAITHSKMFRHIPETIPIRIEDLSLRDIIENDIKPLESLYTWTEENTVREYEQIIGMVLA